MYENLFKNTWGTIVDIVSHGTPIDLMSMLLSPVNYAALERGVVNIGEGSSYMASFKKVSQEDGEITYELDKDSVFVLNFQKKVFLNNEKVTIKTIRGKGGFLNDVLLCFQSPDGFKEAVEDIKTMYGCEVKQLTPSIVQYEGFDAMWRAYRNKKTPEDIAIENAIAEVEKQQKGN